MKNNRAIRWLIFAGLILSFSAASFAQIAVGVGISVRIGPPAIPVYAQPICPGPGYMWTPGYWAWNDVGGYYWVPGTWVVGPVGLLWTPGYWGWNAGFYGWHAGYWGPHIGFYGGINYGFGYGGVGFAGGEWRGGSFFYNRSVMNVNVTNVTNVYNKTVVVNNNHVAFNGGTGGVVAQPTAEEQRFAQEQHTPALAAQTEHEHAASQNKEMFASANQGRPAVAATGRPGEFSGKDVVAARSAGAPYHAPAMSPQQARVSPSEAHAAEAKSANNRENNRPESRPAENRPAESRPSNTESRANNSERRSNSTQSHPQAAHNQTHEPKSQPKQQPKQQKQEHAAPAKHEGRG
jgi:hypothetical protein